LKLPAANRRESSTVKNFIHFNIRSLTPRKAAGLALAIAVQFHYLLNIFRISAYWNNLPVWHQFFCKYNDMASFFSLSRLKDRATAVKKHNILNILLLLFLSALIMYKQLVSADYFSIFVEDSVTFSNWAWQFIEALKEGILYPRWTSLNFWGYGSPTFILYPPLVFYFTALLKFFTDSLITAMNIAKFTSLFISGIGMFYFVKEFYSEKIAILSATFYIALPFNILNQYYFGTFSSVFSLLWFPPILLFAHRYLKNKQYQNVIYSGICYGGLILTHLISAYMFSFVIVAFIIWQAIDNKRPRDIITIPIIILIGVLISSAYLLPLLYEKNLINLKAFLTLRDSFSYSDFFFVMKMTKKNFLIFEFNVLFFFFIILLDFYLSLKLKCTNIVDNTETIHKFFLGAAIGSIFLLFSPSSFLWETIPFFKYIQFPFRWLLIISFCVSFLAASMFYKLNILCKNKKIYYLSIALLFLLCILLNCFYIKNANRFAEKQLLPVKKASWISIIGGSPIEHLPINVEIKKIDKEKVFKEKRAIIKGSGIAEIVEWKSAERIFKIIANDELTVRIRTFNFPGWTANIDGIPAVIKSEDGTKAILVDVPKGNHLLKLSFRDTPIRIFGKIISLLSFMVFSAILLLQTATKS